MARQYGKVETTIWQKRKFRALSEKGKVLWLYMVTCPHGNSVGCYVLPLGYACADLSWQEEIVSQHVSELVSKGFIERDEANDLTWIIGWWGHNTIENKNVAMAAVKAIEALPQCYLLRHAFNDLDELPDALADALRKDYPDGLPNPIETKKPEPEPEPEPKPEPSLDSTRQAATPDPVSRETSDLEDDLIRAVDLWDGLAKRRGLAVIRKLSPPRRAALIKRLAEWGIEGWEAAIGKIEENPWMLGDNDRGWRADFDFLIKDGKFTKLIEGSYDRKQSNGSKPNHRH